MKHGVTVALLVVAAMAGTMASARAQGGRIEERALPYTPLPADIQALDEVIKAPLTDDFVAKSFTAPDGRIVPYRLLTPATATVQLAQARLPLVIVLHGSGSIGQNNVSQMTAFAKAWALPALRQRFPAYVVAPQVDVRSADYAPGGDGLLASHPGASLPAILALVDDLLGRLPVDPARVYVVGFSMGASAALDALVAQPGRFAAAVAFSAVPPDRDRAVAVAGTPTMQVHGDQDTENPFDPDHAWAEAVAAAGGAPIFVRYQGMEHRVPPDMILAPGWREWLFAQRLKSAAPFPNP